MIFEILLYVSLGLLAYSYIVYPAIIYLVGKLYRDHSFLNKEYFPSVTIIMAVHNEERVLADKIDSLQRLIYPKERLTIVIGSDCSNDGTDEMLGNFERSYSNLRVFYFEKRLGKPQIINILAAKADGEILVITDADVIPEREALKNLIIPFQDKSIGLTDSRLSRVSGNLNHLSLQERVYQLYEANLKQAEGKVCGAMMGPSGGFYAVRKNVYSDVPVNYLVDDLFISLNVLLSGYRAIVAGGAFVSESSDYGSDTDYNRRVRISTGNFQILSHFSTLLLKPWKRLFLPFFSHKAIRWSGPFIYLIALVSNAILIKVSFLYSLLFLIQLIFLLLPPLDLALRRLNISIVPLRFITHFALMNLALLDGFRHFIRGVNRGIWVPTKRR
jgi:cellulose synthase/poly-beta-1,6-N-acetylglucosamine synthase-like glycosyltransferase